MNPLDQSPILSVENLSVALPKGADRPFAVESASFTLKRGEILCLVGESGSGKSVLSSALMGAVPEGLKVAGGKVLLGDTDLTALPEKAFRAIRGRDIAMIFQEPIASLNPAMTIAAQIEEVFLLHSDIKAAERAKRARALVESMRLPDPERILKSYPHQLSGGQCQRVVIAMALAMNPRVLVADEPTTALDVTTQAQVLKLVGELRDVHGHGIIFVTHDFGVVADIADRVAVMRHGKIVEIGEAKQVLTAPQHPYTKALIAAVPSLVPHQRPALPDAEPVLTVRDLQHCYGALTVLKDIDLSLSPGRVLSIVGESGCGKSTLARAMIRLIEAKGGRVEVAGTDLLALPESKLRKYRHTIQMIFQDPYGSLNPRRRVGPMIARAARLAGASSAEARRRTEELLDLVGLQKSAYWRKPSAFSGGQRQRIGIARALAMRPDVLIADESVSALDVSVQAQVLALLRDLQEKFQLAIVFITHDLRVAAQISDEIVVMQKGVIVERGTAAQVLAAPTHPYTQTLLDAAPGRNSF